MENSKESAPNRSETMSGKKPGETGRDTRSVTEKYGITPNKAKPLNI